jgi:2'-5' RNA ligase
VRLFAALDLPDDVRGRLVRWGTGALGDPALRPIRPEALHLTLVFLGYVPEERVEEVTELLRATNAAAPELRFEPAPVPIPRRRPRLFAIDAPSEGAIAVQAELSGLLEAAGLYRPEKRPFWSHLTVARVRPESRGSTLPARVAAPPPDLPAPLLKPFRAVRLALYRSQLRPSGAEYVSLANVELPLPGG